MDTLLKVTPPVTEAACTCPTMPPVDEWEVIVLPSSLRSYWGILPPITLPTTDIFIIEGVLSIVVFFSDNVVLATPAIPPT